MSEKGTKPAAPPTPPDIVLTVDQQMLTQIFARVAQIDLRLTTMLEEALDRIDAIGGAISEATGQEVFDFDDDLDEDDDGGAV